MNKKVLTQYVVEPNVLQPFTTEELDWVQANVSGMTQGIVQGLVTNSIFASSPCIINGLKVSDMKVFVGSGNYLYLPCWIWEPNSAELYRFDGGDINPTSGEYFHITTTFPDPSDPLIFSDGIGRDVMEYRHLILNNTAAGAAFQYSGLTSLTAEDWITVDTTGSTVFQNSWETRTPTVQFQLNPLSQRVYFQGSALNNSTAGNGQTIFTLPVGYRPAVSKQFACFGYDNTNNPSIILVEVDLNGDVKATWLNTPTNNLISWFDNISFSINN